MGKLRTFWHNIAMSWRVFKLWLWVSFGFPIAVAYNKFLGWLSRQLVRIAIKLDDKSTQFMYRHRLALNRYEDRYSSGELTDRY